MPKVAMNYQNNIIYKIQHKTIDELIYIGSTTNFAKRKWCHKSKCYNENNIEYKTKKYVMIRENGGWDMFDMVLVKKYPCNDYLEAFAEEERMRRELNANMNTYRCLITQEDTKEYNKKYCETHKEELSEKRKQYRETHKEEIRENAKQYYETHQEEIRENSKQYYETHKEYINEKVECECGCIVTQRNLSTHKKTPKHFKLVNNKN
tara:strand:+ start:137 stop:757 length:621 start_codon:yes stop_codon:yes gene_type:complete